jgi:4-aminobutyrate aminotransferase-like enzyme
VYNNVPSVGHCHPRVVEAIARQAAQLSTNTRYLYGIIHDYAERLLATFPPELANVMFTCTGSESNDLAMQIARAVTGGAGFIVTRNAYHGNTTAVHDLSPSAYAAGQAPPPFGKLIAAPDAHAAAVGDGGVAGNFAAGVERAVAELRAQGLQPAALVADSIFSSDGVFADPPGFLQPAVDVIRRAGGLFIADEVQPGFGRTGGGHWGFARHGVVPDVVTMGKPMGNGYPMGGVVVRLPLLEKFCAVTSYFNTFGGNPVAAAAGLAVLDVLRDERLIDNARDTGDYLRQGLRALRPEFPAIGDVRGAGLFTGLEFSRPGSCEPDARLATAVINAMKERRVLIGAAGRWGNILKIRPPLCFSRENADFFLDALRGALREHA